MQNESDDNDDDKRQDLIDEMIGKIMSNCGPMPDLKYLEGRLKELEKINRNYLAPQERVYLASEIESIVLTRILFSADFENSPQGTVASELTDRLISELLARYDSIEECLKDNTFADSVVDLVDRVIAPKIKDLVTEYGWEAPE